MTLEYCDIIQCMFIMVSWARFIEIILVCMLSVNDACGRVPGKPTTPAPVPDTTTEAFSHRKPCTDSEKHKKGCLQNGECFAVHLGGNRTLSCKCPEMFTGQRCEELSPDIFEKLREEEKVVTASIAAGVSVLIISLTMGIIYAVVKVKRRRNRQETRLNGVPKKWKSFEANK
ncbi:pro-neuregulin-2, membrane-bound isoform-like isoform X2 [Haliotis rubra]|uniref:pro-neuregulin-2, membrane-bound isoform-like isoform X2 n=1 Tax=Haliotis rubra TaxID=36100 RepID=UPI001EE502A7|nr:pro-neuregulin-2, membrane-bound isoform-like isoform X2 [Haliotis rubra]